MAAARLCSVLHQLGAACSTASDAELLERFRARRDEAAFTQLLRRHGPMVIGVGRRLLRQEAQSQRCQFVRCRFGGAARTDTVAAQEQLIRLACRARGDAEK
jgi:hypothetical protein